MTNLRKLIEAANIIVENDKLEAIWNKYGPRSKKILAYAKNFARDSEYAYLFAYEVLKEPWSKSKKVSPELAKKAERIIAKDAGDAYLYAQDVLKTTWDTASSVDPRTAKIAELSIANNQEYADAYSDWFGFEYEDETRYIRLTRKEYADMLSAAKITLEYGTDTFYDPHGMEDVSKRIIRGEKEFSGKDLEKLRLVILNALRYEIPDEQEFPTLHPLLKKIVKINKH